MGAMGVRLWISLAVVACALPASLGAMYSGDSGVKNLSADNFEKGLQRYGIMLVEFYAPWVRCI